MLFSLPSMAQVHFSSLQEVLDYAEKNAVSIRSAQIEENVNASNLKHSKGFLLPSVNGTAGFSDNIILQPTLVPAQLLNPSAPEGTFAELLFGRKFMHNTGVQVTWDVLNFQKWFAVKAAEEQSRLGKAATILVKYDTYYRLAETYYSILLVQQYLDISTRNLQTIDSICLKAKDKYSEGIIREEEFNRAEIQRIQAQNDLDNLNYSLKELHNQLQVQLGVSETITLSEQMLSEGNNAMNGITTTHPDVLVQEAQVDLARSSFRQAKTGYYPSVTLGYQYNYFWASDRFMDLGNANRLPQQFWGATLSIPIFNGFSVSEKVSQSKLALRQQELLLDDQRLNTAKADETLLSQYWQTKNQLGRTEDILKLQEINDRHTENRYESGVIGLDERLDKYRDLLSVQNQYMQSLSDYYINRSRIYIRQIAY